MNNTAIPAGYDESLDEEILDGDAGEGNGERDEQDGDDTIGEDQPSAPPTLTAQEKAAARFKLAAEGAPTYPWPSMAVRTLSCSALGILTTLEMFLTDSLFSSPRLQFSKAQKAAVLRWARDMGAENVPSLYALTACQKKILSVVGDPTERVVSKSGTIFYINDIGKAIAKVR